MIHSHISSLAPIRGLVIGRPPCAFPLCSTQVIHPQNPSANSVDRSARASATKDLSFHSLRAVGVALPFLSTFNNLSCLSYLSRDLQSVHFLISSLTLSLSPPWLVRLQTSVYVLTVIFKQMGLADLIQLTREYKAISENPPPYITAHPSESNILECVVTADLHQTTC